MAQSRKTITKPRGPGAEAAGKEKRRAGAKARNNLIVELSDKEKEEIKEAFELFDTEGSGSIPVNELKVALRALGFEPQKDDVKYLLANIDKGGKETTGMIDDEDFLEIMTAKMSEKDNPEEIETAFALFDEDGTGTISFDNLKRVAQELGEKISDEELREMIFEACKNRYGEVSIEQYRQILSRPT